ncbi:hypothetical protein [Desulfosporosinus fructosivorans]
MSNKDEATREALASELGELKDKYSQMEQAFNELKSKIPPNQGLVPAQGQPTEQQQVQHNHPMH